jgi:hypothetical protein
MNIVDNPLYHELVMILIRAADGDPKKYIGAMKREIRY